MDQVKLRSERPQARCLVQNLLGTSYTMFVHFSFSFKRQTPPEVAALGLNVQQPCRQSLSLLRQRRTLRLLRRPTQSHRHGWILDTMPGK